MRKFLAVFLVLTLPLLPACGQGNPQNIRPFPFSFSPYYEGGHSLGATVLLHADVLEVYEGSFNDAGPLPLATRKPYIVMKCQVIHDFFARHQSPLFRSEMVPETVFYCWVYNDDARRDMEAVADFCRKADSLLLFGTISDVARFQEDLEADRETVAALLERDPDLPFTAEEAGVRELSPSVRVELSEPHMVPIRDGYTVLEDYLDTLRFTYTETAPSGDLVEATAGAPYYFYLGGDGLSTEELYEVAEEQAQKAVHRYAHSWGYR